MFSRELQEKSLVALTDDHKDRIHLKVMESGIFLPLRDRRSRYHFPLICFLKITVCSLKKLSAIEYNNTKQYS